MTLRKNISVEDIKQNSIDARRNELKLIKFADSLKQTSRYLMLNHSGYMFLDGNSAEYRNRESNRKKNIVEAYEAYIGAAVIVVGDIVENEYVAKFIDTLGDCGNLDGMNTYYEYWSCFKEDNPDLEVTITRLNTEYAQLYGYASREAIFLTSNTMKLHIIFWNLFLCSLDDDIYNKQLPIVIELAHCLNLDEHILRDLCRGVEYVISGKKLSPDCDLQCDTVECARFFLGKEE